jgi:hypothetical protein
MPRITGIRGEPPSTTSSTPSQPAGSPTSSETDSSPLEESTADLSASSGQLMLWGLGSVTSSPGSEVGVTPSDERVSLTTLQSGQALVPVSRSQTRARGAERATLDIFGQHGSHSSKSVALQSSLESRLRARMASGGSTLFTLTLSDAITPSGRRILALRASARRISDSGSTSSPWPTTTREDARSSARHGYMITGNQGTTLLDAARLAILGSWPTTQARDGNHGGGQAKRAMGETRHGSNLDDFALLAPGPWATLVRENGDHSRTDRGRPGPNLSEQAQRAGWATPVSTELGNTLENYRAMKANMKSGARTAITHPSLQAQLVVSGEMSSGSPASTESRGQLNPDLSRWLMAYPVEWLFACPADLPKKKPSASTGTAVPARSEGSATRSSRSKPSSSSKRPATPAKKRKGKRGRKG